MNLGVIRYIIEKNAGDLEIGHESIRYIIYGKGT
jgi:hypothetical protein